MKERRTLNTALIALLAGFAAMSLVFGARGTAQERRGVAEVAVCDVLEVFRNYERAADITQEMQQRRNEINRGMETRTATIERMRDDMQSFLPGSEEYDSRLKEVEKETIEANAWEEYQMSMAGYYHHTQMTQMYDEILAMTKTVADERGHRLVLFRESPDTRTQSLQELLTQIQNRTVLYAASDADLTNIVVSRLNAQYTQGE